MSRIRSPNYPSISLADALDRVKKVHERERQHPMSRDVAMKGMGYGGINGASLGALSAARKYGLLERAGKGDEYRVSDRAVTILHPHNPQEKADELRKAARAPMLFNELLEHFKGSIPSDDNLRAYLIRRGFSQSSLTGVLGAFRDTMELAQGVFADYDFSTRRNDRDDEDEEDEGMGEVEKVPAPSRRMPPPPISEGPMKVSFTGISVEVSAVLTDAAAIDGLVKALEAMKALLPPSKEEKSN